MVKTFSIVVPIYKVEKFLKECIDSILNQTFSDFELILVDDGSPDKCPEICDHYAEQDSRVKVIHKENGGLVSARNAGIKASKGNYICYVDGDDRINETLLETVYREAVRPYEPDMVIFGLVKKCPDKDTEVLTDLQDGLYEKDQLKELVYPYMMYDSRKPFCKGLLFPAACNKIYKRELLLKHYCRDERIRMGEDNAFVFECAYFSDRIYICNKILYYYNRLNPNAMTHSYDAQRFENNRFLYDYMEKRLGNIEPVLDGQLNAFKAYWLIMAVFHEIKCGRPLISSAKHIRREINKNCSLNNISFKSVPPVARVFLAMLKVHFYFPVLLGGRAVNHFRK